MRGSSAAFVGVLAGLAVVMGAAIALRPDHAGELAIFSAIIASSLAVLAAEDQRRRRTGLKPCARRAVAERGRD